MKPPHGGTTREWSEYHKQRIEELEKANLALDKWVTSAVPVISGVRAMLENEDYTYADDAINDLGYLLDDIDLLNS